jgi:hypothetical protein
MSRRTTMAIAATTLIAAGVWAVSELADSDPPQRKGSGLRVQLTEDQAEEVERIALQAEEVQELTAGRDPRVVNTVVWHDRGDWVIGARVEIALDPPIKEFKAVVPAFLEPNEDAPPGTPDLNREVRYEARNVSVLTTRVDLDSGRMIEIAPEGPEAEVLSLRALGPKLKKYYYGKAD